MSDRETYLQMLEARSPIGQFVDARRIGLRGGGGNFSLMLSATDASSHERVALKFFNPERLGETYRVASFEREAQLLEELADDRYLVPIVAPMADHSEPGATSSGVAFAFSFRYYAMRLARASVQELVAGSGLTTADAIEVFAQMCRAVQYVHRCGVTHRDIKPENFLVLGKGAVRLADLGTARRLADPPLSSRYPLPPGDPRYAPPEQIAGLLDLDEAIAYQGDIFALGASLYELLTGAQLYPLIYDTQVLSDLHAISLAPVGSRRAVFDGVIDAIANTRRVPSISGVRGIPASVSGHLDRLILGMSAFDYGSRSTFASVFRTLAICRIILRNEASYQKWLAEKRRRRALRESR